MTNDKPLANGKAEGTTPVEGKKLAGKFLTFKLAGEEYGIGILKVREINGLMDITPVPRMPSFVRGVINLRGKVIPVVDLRLKFGLEGIQDTKQTCIIVVDIRVAEMTTLVGLLVDTVSEVVNIQETEIDLAQSFGGNVSNSFILGAAKVKGAVKILLDIEKIISVDELTTFVQSH